jgi:hypothetical protein
MDCMLCARASGTQNDSRYFSSFSLPLASTLARITSLPLRWSRMDCASKWVRFSATSLMNVALALMRLSISRFAMTASMVASGSSISSSPSKKSAYLVLDTDPSRMNDKTAKNKRFLPVGKIASHNSPKQKKREQLTNIIIYIYISLSLCCAVLASLLLNIIKRYVPIATWNSWVQA